MIYVRSFHTPEQKFHIEILTNKIIW